MNWTELGEHWLRTGAFGLALIAEGIAVLIIAGALIHASLSTLGSTFARHGRHPWADVRLDLGRYLALALEFLLAADVVRTAVAPTWPDIGKLAAIAVIRTGLNYFLSRDIHEAAREREGREIGQPDRRSSELSLRNRRAA